jgi:hypothetical protein
MGLAGLVDKIKTTVWHALPHANGPGGEQLDMTVLGFELIIVSSVLVAILLIAILFLQED